MSETKQWQRRRRSVVVKDKPDALRPWRWSIEKWTGSDWQFERAGRAFSYGGALRKAARKGVLCPWLLERTELEVVTRDKPREVEPVPLENPLPPELLGTEGER